MRRLLDRRTFRVNVLFYAIASSFKLLQLFQLGRCINKLQDMSYRLILNL